MPDTAERSLTPGDYAERADAQLAQVSALVRDASKFEQIRRDQWRHRESGRLVEAGYVYGAPWAISWLPEHGQHSADRFEFNGRDTAQLDTFKALFV